MLACKHKKDLIKLKQNYSFKFIPGSSEIDALNKAGGDINSMHDYDVIFLANSLAKRHPDGNQIYFIKQKNNLLKNIWPNLLNIFDLYLDLRISEDLTLLLEKKPTYNPNQPGLKLK